MNNILSNKYVLSLLAAISSSLIYYGGQKILNDEKKELNTELKNTALVFILVMTSSVIVLNLCCKNCPIKQELTGGSVETTVETIHTGNPEF